MVKNHLKRLSTPNNWDILRKQNIFITRPNPGRDASICVSLNTVLKEMIGKTRTSKETRYLLKHDGVMVNSKRVYDEKFPVGFLDTISFPKSNKHYRLLVGPKAKLVIVEISADDAKLKLSKLKTKKYLPGSKLQFNCTDGRNFLQDKKNSELEKARRNDSLLYALPGQELKKVLKLEKGELIYLYKGTHAGRIVVAEEFRDRDVIFKINDEEYETKKAYAFAIGAKKPEIMIPWFGESQAAKEKKQEKKAKQKNSGKAKTDDKKSAKSSKKTESKDKETAKQAKKSKK